MNSDPPDPQRFAYGKKPPKDAPAIPFARVRTTRKAVVEHPEESETDLGDAPLLLLFNAKYGTCVGVTTAMERRVASGTGEYPAGPENYVAWVYRTQNPGFDPNSSQPGGPDDQGMDIQTLLEYLHANGDRDGHKVVAFAKVDHTNLEDVRAALYEFGALWIGQVVSGVNQNQFPATCWTRDGSPEGGHSTYGYGYDPDRVKHQTWADIGCLSNPFVEFGTSRDVGVDEMWVALWDDQVAGLTGDQRQAWSAAYADLTGGEIVWPDTPGPQPTPPEPTPDPAPAPDPVATFLIEAETWLSHRHLAPVNIAFEQPVRDIVAYLTSGRPAG